MYLDGSTFLLSDIPTYRKQSVVKEEQMIGLHCKNIVLDLAGILNT